MRRGWWAVLPALALAALTGCTQSSAGRGQHIGSSSSTSPVASTTVSTSSAHPSVIASDSPSDTPSTSDGSEQQPQVIITYARWDSTAKEAQVSAFVTGVLVSHATCTLTLTSGGVTRTASHAAVPNASSMSCGQLAVPGSQLTTGTWSATVTFQFAGVSATSDPSSIAVSG